MAKLTKKIGEDIFQGRVPTKTFFETEPRKEITELNKSIKQKSITTKTTISKHCALHEILQEYVRTGAWAYKPG